MALTTTTTTTTASPVSTAITGNSTSRLSEVEKYSKSSNFFDRYFLTTTTVKDGVVQSQSNISSYPKKIVYYIGGIRYEDVQSTPTSAWITTFFYEGQGYSSPDFIDVPAYKDPNKENIIQNPKIENDVFIDREEMSAFQKNYNLEYIESLSDLETFAAGNYFNIVNNT
jgi:hypothetical protein